LNTTRLKKTAVNMYSKFFQHTDTGMLEAELDEFLQALDAVTGNIVSIKISHHDGAILVLVIYNCWKKL